MTDEDDTVVINESKSDARPARKATQNIDYIAVCISIYPEDHEAALAKVAMLKERGFTQMSLSRLIRIALDRIDVNVLERDLRAAGVRR